MPDAGFVWLQRMGMALMDMTKRALTAEAELATLRARTCAPGMHTWRDEYATANLSPRPAR